MQGKAILICVAGAILLSGCEERDPVLTGERLGIREVLSEGDPLDQQEDALDSRPISLGAQSSNANWPQSGVSRHVRVDHAAFGAGFQPVWTVPIGTGDSRRQRLNADPVAANGRIFTMDAEHTVRATSSNGAPIWSYTLTPDRDDPKQAQGGGLAVDNGRLYVASGFGRLVALDPSSGAEIWTQRLGSTATGAPSVRDGVLYVVSGHQIGWALEADTGLVRWQVEATKDVSNVAGAPAPAIGDKHVVFGFGSGTVQGVFRQGGLRLWNSDLLGRRNGVTLAAIDDITGDPLIDGDTVYAGNHSGRVTAMSVHTGERVWTTREGALGPLWPAGDSVFFVSDRNRLIRLDASSGERIWVVDLPGYKPSRKPSRRRDESFANHGPILAGGRLIVASSDGLIRAFDPTDGRQVGSVEIAGGATTRPIVAGGVLYVVSSKGVLHAFR